MTSAAHKTLACALSSERGVGLLNQGLEECLEPGTGLRCGLMRIRLQEEEGQGQHRVREE